MTQWFTPREPTSAPGEVTWAMDICGEIGHPYYGNPIRAHQIVRIEGDPGINEIRVTACGKRLTRHDHPRGWWSTRPGELPLAAHAVHCTAADTQEAMTSDEGTA